jgi:hypothetical protein
LDTAGEWAALSPEVNERFAAVAEMIAIMVSSELGDRAELLARFGTETLEVRSGGGMVTALLRTNDVHPLVVKTALQRVELASVRSARLQESVELNLHRPPVRSFRLDDDAPVPSFRPAVSSHRFVTAPNGGSGMASSDEFCDFEIDFFADNQAPPASELECSWGDAAAWIQGAVQWSAGFVGRSVASNYWRELLLSEASLTAAPRVTHEGNVLVDSGADARITAGDARALQALYHVWLTRCARVIPNASVVVDTTLPNAPWQTESSSARSDQ